MTKVAITESYLEDIADAIRSKTGVSSATYYPSEMADAIMTISGSGGITPTGTISITENGTYNVTSYASADVSVPTGSTINNQNKTVNPTTSQQSITYDSGYTGLGTVTVNAMPSGTAGTPTVTKGAVSNHAVSMTPSVTNTTGYITGSTKTGTAVTVSASELVSGSETKTENGTYDVTNLAELIVNISGGGSVTQDENGFIILPSTGGGSPSIGGLEYETGTWSPSEDVASDWIPFTGTHTVAPFYFMIAASDEEDDPTLNSNYEVCYFNWAQVFGGGFVSDIHYARVFCMYRGSSTAALSATNVAIVYPYTDTTHDSLSGSSRYWTTEDGIKAYTNSTSRYWRSNRTYKWIAVWSPTI